KRIKLELRNSSGTVVSTEVDSPALLAIQLGSALLEFGEHRASFDRRFDEGALYASNNIDFATLISVLDALYSPKRDFNFKGQLERVPILNVTLLTAEQLGQSTRLSDSPVVDDRLPAENIQRVVMSNSGPLHACYDAARDKTAHGTLRIA